ncbi:DUF1016 N-terminal domain-containing protein [Dyadobacter arcticus]|uniref:DUF1016 N-terminal domain-containing protein n=1 Tax=Dyadobacter arcticus TaxID=1078754 RepID=UPI00142330D4
MNTKLTNITWYHHVTLLSKISNPDQRMFFIKLSSKNRWSRDAMLTYIRTTGAGSSLTSILPN